MKIYLVQHAAALSSDEDAERPLSDQGRVDTQRIGDFVASAGIRVAHVMHSGKKRAEETARILASALDTEDKVQKAEGLHPNDPVTRFADTLDKTKGDMLIVGHLPFMARFVSYLAIGDASKLRVEFRPGSLVCLEQSEDGTWSLAWMIRPELLQLNSR